MWLKKREADVGAQNLSKVYSKQNTTASAVLLKFYFLFVLNLIFLFERFFLRIILGQHVSYSVTVYSSTITYMGRYVSNSLSILSFPTGGGGGRILHVVA